MNSSIKALRSTFNLMLSIVELMIGLSFAIKIFGSNISSDGGLMEYVGDILERAGGGASSALGNLDMSGPLAFLLLILGFMVFSFTLVAQIPKIIRQSKRRLRTEAEWE
ncbi:MAG: hypothetical protein Q8L10_03185 [Candidatus Moranbacteria bacterium]|nr:hypothetical protein [Candidatus Moranbacteria bacterium]